ncbi:ABC transporter substrate-binding protein [Aromatoleum sp.]|uniref:ABC transporter substrate-binding protein n=1 Tax=Aromatoleum sp. TaxID=2307007 RepID=UPI002FC5FE3D
MSATLRGLPAALLLLLVLATALFTGDAAAARVLLVTSERSGAHEETLAAIRTALVPGIATSDIGILEPSQVENGTLAGSRIIVTIGTEAAQAVTSQSPRQPVLHTLLPRDAYERLPATTGTGRSSAIFLDQPVQRQIALITEALPDWRRLALLAGPRSLPLATQLAAAAQEQQLSVNIENISSERDIYPALQRLLADRAVLLALPDSTVFNSYTIQNVLLTSYRHRSPLIGFSPAYVRAGALLGLYSTPAQIGDQAAEAIRTVLAGGGLPPPQASRRFEIGINQNVANSLGIRLEPAAEIAARISRRETKP